ncbi:MAG: hemolysin family protein [marine benthic group bacterium]|nr:hemolysin family protein [Candidatus Benthicola marisminoris]
MTTLIVGLAILVALSGFFSGSEIAFFSIPDTRAEALAKEKRRGARALVRLKSNSDRLLITLLIGNNIANIGAASVATYAATEAFGSAGVGIATGAMTLLILFFGEIVPKSFAAANAESISLATAPLFLALSKALSVLVVPLEALTRSVLPDSRGVIPTVTEAEIHTLTEIGHEVGEIDPHERRIIQQAFKLDTTQAWEVMTPRVGIFALPAERSLAEIASELQTVPFSRIPVYGDSLDDIAGILYVRDAYQALISGQRDVTLGRLAREALFVPATVVLSQLLAEFQARRIHAGVVVDEHGGTDGLITLEDILEELVGEIVDETDVPAEAFQRAGRDSIIVEGGVDLREINHFFNCSLPVLEHRSLNGYLMQAFGKVPDPGDSVEAEGLRIEVISASDTQVTRARVTRLREENSGEEDATV